MLRVCPCWGCGLLECVITGSYMDCTMRLMGGRVRGVYFVYVC